MANVLPKKLAEPMAPADQRLDEEERGKGPAEHQAARHADAGMPDRAPAPRPEDFAIARRLIEDLDARRDSVEPEIAGGGLLQDAAEEGFLADAEAPEDTPPVRQQTATPTISFSPTNPARVTVTKTDKVDAPVPSGFDLSNLIEDFPTEEDVRAVGSGSSEPRATDRAAGVPGTENTGRTKESQFGNRQEPVDSAKMAAPPVAGGSTSATRPQSRPAKQQNERDNQDRQTMGPGGAASEDRPSIDMDGKTETVPIEYLRPNRLQPRRRFDKDGLRALADSIKENGVLQPILVRRHSGRRNQFEIVAGERRYRAAKLARLQAVPVVIREISDRQALEFALVENIQRRDLTPLERAEGYHRLIQEFNHTQEDLARVLCKSRSHVANTLRLLNLSPAIKGLLQDGKLSAGHARALLNAVRPEELAQRIVSDGLSVRATENFAQPAKTNGPGSPIIKAPKSPEIVILERDLAALLGLTVTISTHGRGGTLAVRFTSPEQLEDILRRLSTVDGVSKMHPVRDDKFAQKQ